MKVPLGNELIYKIVESGGKKNIPLHFVHLLVKLWMPANF